MRQERTFGRFAEENRREAARMLAAAAGAEYASPGVMPATPAAQHVVAIERARLDGTSTARNARVDMRPTARQAMSAERWGPLPALPTASDAAAERAADRARLIGAILNINAQLSQRHRGELETLRDGLAEQLRALDAADAARVP